MSTHQFENYFKLQMMVLEANNHTREIFKQEWQRVFNTNSVDNKELNNFFRTRLANYKLRKAQQDIMQNGSLNDWDLTLLGTVLNEEPFKPNSLRYIQKLIEFRNKIAHCSDLTISNEQFDKFYDEFCLNMKSAGFKDEQKLVSFRTMNAISSDSNPNYTSCSDSERDEKLLENEDYEKLRKQADEEFDKKNYKRAIELYTNTLLHVSSLNVSSKKMARLYYQRSLSYYKYYESQSEEQRDDIDLNRSLADAEKICMRDPSWLDGYLRCAETCDKLNKFKKAIDYYEKALVLEVQNESIRNKLAFVKQKFNERMRQELLNPYSPDDRHLEEFGVDSPSDCFTDENKQRIKEFLKDSNSSYSDVFQGHEFYYGSKKVKQSYEKAAECYEKAIKNSNNPEAMYHLAVLYMHGKGVEVNFKMAFKLLKEAIEQPAYKDDRPNVGVAESLHLLGLSYDEGTYVDPNPSIAASYYDRATELNYAPSAMNLGMMYQCGKGVVKDLDKAERLLLLSHRFGNTNAAYNLSTLYLEKNDPDRALMWHQRGIREMSPLAIKEDQKIRDRIQQLKELNQSVNPKDKDQLKEILNLMRNLNTFNSAHVPIDKNPIKRFDYKLLEKQAQNGSITASNIIYATYYFYSALKMLDQKDYDLEKFVNNLFLAYTTEQIACGMPSDKMDDVIETVETAIVKDLKKKCDLDYKARVVYSFLKQNINITTNSLKKYPDAKELLEIRAALYVFDNQPDKSLDDINKILSKCPNDYENLSHKAGLLKNKRGKEKEAIDLYKKFVAAAPNDHRKLPEAYYAMGYCVMGSSKTNNKSNSKIENKLIKEYYEKGLECEKRQLPCFLPYESQTKMILQLILNMNIDEDSSNKSQTNQTNTKSSDDPKIDTILKDIRRINIIKDHRNYYSHLQLPEKQGGHMAKLTIPPPKTQSIPNSLVGLKETYIKDIDFTKDHIMKGVVLNLKSIEIPAIGYSVALCVEDENGYAERVCIYNLKESKEEILKTYGVGAMFSVINPYVRIATDGKPVIRIDDPRTIFMSGQVKHDLCRFCIREESKFQCSKCSNAKYCSKQCQENDWKILNHKLVCN